jgi:2-oxoacid:acceptor oxidoreductase gamma subunit (pyruvate/2-ketoisovalerate family)
VDQQPVQLRTNIYNPDHIVVLDPTLVEAVDVTSGLKPGGWIILNTYRPPQEFPQLKTFRAATVDATSIALRNGLGSRTSPIVNTAILGAFSKATSLVGIDSIALAIREEIQIKKEGNIHAAREAYQETKIES